jgi:hypothetical protein
LKKPTTLRLLAAVAALAALTAVGVGGAASASPAPKGPPVAHIKFKGGKKNLHLVVPDTIRAGTTIEVDNLTDPQKVGPHTFSLVKRDALPHGKDQIKKCEKELKLICGAIAFKWHLVDPTTFEVGQILSDVGEEGWDTPGDRHKIGDSWVSEAKDETFSAPLSSQPRKLHYICAVHPFLKGSFTVTPAPPAKR